MWILVSLDNRLGLGASTSLRVEEWPPSAVPRWRLCSRGRSWTSWSHFVHVGLLSHAPVVYSVGNTVPPSSVAEAQAAIDPQAGHAARRRLSLYVVSFDASSGLQRRPGLPRGPNSATSTRRQSCNVIQSVPRRFACADLQIQPFSVNDVDLFATSTISTATFGVDRPAPHAYMSSRRRRRPFHADLRSRPFGSAPSNLLRRRFYYAADLLLCIDDVIVDYDDIR